MIPKRRFPDHVAFVIAHDKFMVWHVREVKTDMVIYRSRTYSNCLAFIVELQKGEA